MLGQGGGRRSEDGLLYRVNLLSISVEPSPLVLAVEGQRPCFSKYDFKPRFPNSSQCVDLGLQSPSAPRTQLGLHFLPKVVGCHVSLQLHSWEERAPPKHAQGS